MTAKQQTANSKQQRGKGPKKPPARTVPSDDCVVTVDGVEYHPHEGEWVKVVPGYSVGDLQLQREMQSLAMKLDAASGEADEAQKKIALVDDSYESAIGVLSHRLRAWNWTSDDGEALPQPAGNPAAFQHLRVEEVMYLVAAVQGETPGDQKNGSRPSGTSSSATARQPSRA